MPFTEFYCQSGGSNLNAGSTTNNTAAFTYASGNWVAGTGVFTVASGDPASDGVAVGDFASVYPDGSSVAVFIGRVTARSSTTITVSLTAKSGTAPTDGTGNRTLKIGGAWQGPNGAVGFPFPFTQRTMRDASDNHPRINFKNGTAYAITAAITTAGSGDGCIRYEGYTTTPGDGGLFVISGPTTGAGFTALTIAGACHELVNLELYNNGSTSNNVGVAISGQAAIARRVIVHDVRGSGLSLSGPTTLADECEVYASQQSNTSGQAGISLSGTGACARNSISHHNTGSNSSGFSYGTNQVIMEGCIAHDNGFAGVIVGSSRLSLWMFQCDFYDNGSDAIRNAVNIDPVLIYAVNCNFLKNNGYAANFVSGNTGSIVRFINCGIGQGTMANTSGIFPASVTYATSENEVLYTANTTPWVDPDDGDFRISGSQAKGTGRGSFTQTQSGYGSPNATVGYPDIGAAQHQDSGGGNTVITKRKYIR